MAIDSDKDIRIAGLLARNRRCTNRGIFFWRDRRPSRDIRDAQISDSELRFMVERTFEGNPSRLTRAFTRARVNGAGLAGVTDIDGKVYRWSGWRSPDIADRDDGSWREGQPVDLLRSGLAGRMNDWQLTDGVLKNLTPRAELLVSRDSFWNFKLHVEYKLPPKGNSGIGLRIIMSCNSRTIMERRPMFMAMRRCIAASLHA